jgi:putative phage-type endonuclease
MTATVILQRNNRSSWLRLRSQGLGGTDVAAVLGFDHWRTPLDVWLDKTGRGERTPSSYPMRRGSFMESFLLAEYGRATGAIIEKPPALLAHPDYPMVRASLDALAHHRDRTVILDAKAPTWRGRTDWWDEEKLCPDGYAVQMLTYLAVTGLDEAVLVADVAGDLTLVTIARDLAWEAAVLPLLADWWTTYVLGDMPPPADWERDTIPALNRAWVVADGESTEASAMVAAAVKVWQQLSPPHRERGRTLDQLKVQVREGMRNAQHLTIDGTRVASIDKRGGLRIKGAGNEDV